MPPSPRINARHHEDWIVADEIEMAPAAWGRPIRASDVRRIAATFDPDMFGALALWRRAKLPVGAGRYTLCDGQHRLAAVRFIGWGDQRVPCLIYDDLTMETAAELSLGLQDRRNLHALDKHRGAVAAHDRRAVEIDKVLAHQGLALVYTTSGVSRRRVSAVGMLGYIWDCTGVTGLERVLAVCDRAWEGTCPGFAGNVMKLVALVVAAHNGEVDDDHLVRALASRSPGQWIAKDSTPRRALPSIAQDVILEYNKRVRGAKRLPELTPSQYSAAGKRTPAVRVKRGKLDLGGAKQTASSTQRRTRGPGRHSQK